MTRLHPVAWQGRHAAQQKLYEAVTDYVRHGYNQAMAAKQRHIGFLMILMQRLVTSSTAAIRATLEKRQALPRRRRPRTPPAWRSRKPVASGEAALDEPPGSRRSSRSTNT